MKLNSFGFMELSRESGLEFSKSVQTPPLYSRVSDRVRLSSDIARTPDQ